MDVLNGNRQLPGVGSSLSQDATLLPMLILCLDLPLHLLALIKAPVCYSLLTSKFLSEVCSPIFHKGVSLLLLD